MIHTEPFQLVLIIFTIFSTLWAIRAHFKNYQKEDSIKSAEAALTAERITYLNQNYEGLNHRLSEVERQQSEMHTIRVQVSTMHEDLQALKSKIDSVIKILLEKV